MGRTPDDPVGIAVAIYHGNYGYVIAVPQSTGDVRLTYVNQQCYNFRRGMNVPKPYYDLKDVREAVLSGRAFVAHRAKNVATLDALGFSDADALAEIVSLNSLWKTGWWF